MSSTSCSTAEGFAFTLGGARLVARGSGALFWPEQNLLVVSDLHLGKSERMARRGGALLPPYDTRDTLFRLEAEIDALAPARVIGLGDSFDDAEAALDDAERLWLTRLMAGRDWTWITGNHDPAPMEVGGTHRDSLTLGPLIFRHIADGAGHEVSGHWHPKARLGGTARPCFLFDARHAILPAFGTFTGGLWCHDPVLRGQMGPKALAVLTGPRPIAMPCPS